VLQQHWTPDGAALGYLLDDREGSVELWATGLGERGSRLIAGETVLRGLAGDGDAGAAALRGARYRWSPDGGSVLLLISGSMHLLHVADGSVRDLAPSDAPAADPKFSPDGDLVAFVREHDLWIVPADSGETKRLTSGGGETLLHAEADWVYGEEFDVESGFEWSPDGRFIVFYEMDLQSVPVYPIVDELEPEAAVRYQRYPKPGDPNPRVRVGIVEVESGRTAWLDRAAEYVPRIGWADAGAVAVQLMNRAQDELQLVLADPRTGRSRPLLTERDGHWVNVTHDLTFLESSDDFLWTSETNGYRHIYRYDREGGLVSRLTGGEWEVKAIEGLDEENGWVYFTSNETNPLGRDLYRVKIGGGKRERITTENGTHRVTMNPPATAFVDNHSSMTRPPRISLRAVDGGSEVSIFETPSVTALDLAEPRVVELSSPDGGLVRMKLLEPHDKPQRAALPVLVYVYGGPRSPVVSDSWRHQTELFHQLLVKRGFVVAYLDDRSSSRLGHIHETAVSRNWGPHVVADHETAVNHLRSLPYVDPERMAVWGWSGGGYTTCYHMTHTGLFQVGIAVAPVTDWHLYDSIYTERYMGLPADEADAYAATSILEAAGELKGRLLVMHGTGDDNVHPQNTTQLIQALIEAGKPVDLMLYPNKTHSIRGKDARVHLFSKILRYLEEHL
jgi:dipeptidyl-peptidase-4